MPARRSTVAARVVRALALAITCSGAPAAFAQIEKLPAEVRRGLAEFGPKFQSDIGAYIPRTAELFRPLHTNASTAGMTITRDVAVGPDPRHRVDLYRPDGVAKAPILVFFHGGALRSGDRNAYGDAMYANVTRYAARNGLLGVNATYRLAPQTVYPGAAQDVGRVVAWLKENAAQHGGDPDRIFLMGHSSGATHVATWAYMRELHGATGPGVAGVILSSGRLKADNRADDPNGKNVEAYFGTDTSLYAARSPVNYGAQSDVPTFILIAEFDNPFLDVYSADLFSRMCAARGKCPRFHRAVGHNHMSGTFSIGTADDSVGSQVLDFVRTGR
jgi:acetyl esterase/lipase